MNNKDFDNLHREIKQHQHSEPSSIPFKYEKLAFYLCGLFRPKNQYDVFAICASAMLCNAYVKKPYADKSVRKNYAFKRFLYYKIKEMIKKPVAGVRVFHSEGFTLVDVFGIKFSYHSVGDPDHVANAPKKFVDGVWGEEHLRLTPYATEIFSFTKKLIENEELISPINKKIYKMIQDEVLTSDEHQAKEKVKEILDMEETL